MKQSCSREGGREGTSFYSPALTAPPLFYPAGTRHRQPIHRAATTVSPLPRGDAGRPGARQRRAGRAALRSQARAGHAAVREEAHGDAAALRGAAGLPAAGRRRGAARHHPTLPRRPPALPEPPLRGAAAGAPLEAGLRGGGPRGREGGAGRPAEQPGGEEQEGAPDPRGVPEHDEGLRQLQGEPALHRLPAERGGGRLPHRLLHGHPPQDRDVRAAPALPLRPAERLLRARGQQGPRRLPAGRAGHRRLLPQRLHGQPSGERGVRLLVPAAGRPQLHAGPAAEPRALALRPQHLRHRLPHQDQRGDGPRAAGAAGAEQHGVGEADGLQAGALEVPPPSGTVHRPHGHGEAAAAAPLAHVHGQRLHRGDAGLRAARAGGPRGAAVPRVGQGHLQPRRARVGHAEPRARCARRRAPQRQVPDVRHERAAPPGQVAVPGRGHEPRSALPALHRPLPARRLHLRGRGRGLDAAATPPVGQQVRLRSRRCRHPVSREPPAP